MSDYCMGTLLSSILSLFLKKFKRNNKCKISKIEYEKCHLMEDKFIKWLKVVSGFLLVKLNFEFKGKDVVHEKKSVLFFSSFIYHHKYSGHLYSHK